MRLVDQSSRGVLLSVMCLSDRESSIMRRPWPSGGCCAIANKNSQERGWQPLGLERCVEIENGQVLGPRKTCLCSCWASGAGMRW
jgi:hypothetical protein